MKFNDTTDLLGICQEVDFLADTDTTSFPLKDKARLANKWHTRVVNLILQSQDGWDFDNTQNTDFPIATADLVANQQDYKLDLADGVIIVKRLEITYDGTNWYKAEPFDIAEKGDATSTTQIAADFSKDKPFYDIIGSSILLYPIPDANVTGGLKMWSQRINDNHFASTDTTKEPGFDKNFHSIIPTGMTYDFVKKKDPQYANYLLGEIVRMEAEVKKHYGKKQRDRKYILKSVYSINDYE